LTAAALLRAVTPFAGKQDHGSTGMGRTDWCVLSGACEVDRCLADSCAATNLIISLR